MQRLTFRTSAHPGVAILCAALLGAGGPGCGDDGPPASVSVGDGGRRDAGDGGDDGGSDAGDGGGEGGAEGGADGSIDGGGGDGGGSQACPTVAGGSILELPAALGATPPVVTSRVGDAVHVLYGATPCSLGAKQGRGLRALRVPSSGDIGDPVDVVNVGLVGAACIDTLAPSIDATSADQADVYYAAKNSDFFEVYAQQLDPDPVQAEPGTQLTTDPFPEHIDYHLTAAENFGQGPFVAFASEMLSTDAFGIATLRPGIDFAPRVVAAESDTRRPRALAVSPLREGGTAGVLAWLDSGSGSPGVHVVPLDGLGASAGDGVDVEAEIASSASLDIAARDNGAAVVYTVGRTAGELRLLLLDEDGGLERTPVAITRGNERATDASIAPFASGYVIAFRSVQGGGTPTVRLSFVDTQGVVAADGSQDVAEASGTGGQVQVESTNDGRLVLAWPDARPEGDVVRVLRLECN